jgi:hypothetical protein
MSGGYYKFISEFKVEVGDGTCILGMVMKYTYDYVVLTVCLFYLTSIL